MEQRFKILRYILYGVELLVLFVFQGTPHLVPELFGGRPNLLFPAVLTIAMFEPKLPSLFFGLAGGLLTDIGNGGVIGFFAIIATIFCYFTSHLTSEIIRTSLLTSIIITLIAVPAALGLHFVLFYILPGYGEVGYFFINHYLSRILYTIAIMPILYFINRNLALRIASE